MSLINWEEPFYINLATGETSATPVIGSIPWPTYGNYGGGAAYSAGEFGGELLTKSNGDPYSRKKLEKLGDQNEDPLDPADYLYYRHDVESALAGEGYTEAQAEADVSLLKSLVRLDASYDPEASLYAGFATLAMIGSLAINDQLDLVSPMLLFRALEDAVGDIEHGLTNLPEAELAIVLGLLFVPTIDEDVFHFDFSITTSTLGEEAAEAMGNERTQRGVGLRRKRRRALGYGTFPGRL